MDNSFDFSTYLSPFTTRYGTDEMRIIWSEEHKRKLWRKIWVALAKAENKAGLVSKPELDDITSHQNNIDIVRAREIEKEIYHDIMAEIRTFSEQCKIGGGKIHLGATSMDVVDNTTSVQVHEALMIITKQIKDLLSLFEEKIKEYEDLVCMGYTHLQPAEPTTLGYRLAFYAQDLLMDLEVLEKIMPLIKGKGIKGAVGTSASYVALLEGSKMTASELEESVLQDLGIEAVDIAGQTYPRKIDLLVVEVMSNIASSLHKFCFDFRLMQAPGIGEWMEKRDAKRVGSSAMPFKRNPDKAEKVCSLCRYVSALLNVAWSNPANSLLERTLDDSANQRIFLPESFLAINECLKTVANLLTNLEVDTNAVEKNLSTYGQFAATEPLLMELVKRGANRQEMHELIKSCSMIAWQGRGVVEKTLFNLLGEEKEITRYIPAKELETMSSPLTHIGLAKKRTEKFLTTLKSSL